jgi:hypothetical protein
MADIRCLSSGPSEVYVATPGGVYVLDRSRLGYVRAITAADGLEGEVSLCAWNPNRNSLLITTDRGTYEYLRGTGRLTSLYPPFQAVRSIGIAADAAWFDSESGFFRKHRTADEYTPGSPPPDTRWYGRLDTLTPLDFPFLTPYFITDDQLFTHPMTLVYPEPGGRRLLVAVPGHGLAAYGRRSGFREAVARFGPPASPVRRLQPTNDRLWLQADGEVAAVRSADDWTYYRTAPGAPLPAGEMMLNRGLLRIVLSEPAPAFLESGGLGLIGTDRGLYSIDSGGGLVGLLVTPAPVNALARRRDTVMVGTSDGLYVLIDDSLARVDDPFARTDWGVYSAAQSPDGTTWLGTLGGVLALDMADTWRHVLPPAFDLSRPVRALAAADSLVFIGDRHRLRVLDRRTETWTDFDSLFANEVTTLAVFEDALWVAARDVIARFDFRHGIPR